MSIENNKTIVRKLYDEVVGRADFSSLEQLVSPDYLDHNAEHAGQGPAVLRAHVTAMRSTFPNFTLLIVDIVAEHDKVVTRVTGQGTHAACGWTFRRPGHSSRSGM
jgi:predicted ester cyclase